MPYSAGAGAEITRRSIRNELDGMQTFDGELERFIREGLVKKEVAVSYASNANNLMLAISDLP